MGYTSKVLISMQFSVGLGGSPARGKGVCKALSIPGIALMALYAAVWARSILHICCPAMVNCTVLAGGKVP